MKVCIYCNRKKTLKSFSKDSRRKDGFGSDCKKCHNKRGKEYRKENYERESWRKMLRRCNDKDDSLYKYYGGRGVSVCREWMTYGNFLKDMGKSPINTTIDRIDNNGNYEPSNCRWATRKEQANNRRGNVLLTFRGETHTASQWSEMLNLNKYTIYEKVRKKISVEKILDKLDSN